MSQRSIIATIVVIIILIAGAWYFLSYTSGAPASTSTTATTTVATTTDTGSDTSGTPTQTTLGTIVAQGGNYTCSIQTTQNGAQTTGTIYGSGGKTRLDFVISENGVDTTTHVIRTGSTSYTWVDGQQTGTKSAITPTSPIIQPNGGVISVTDTSTLSSSCHPWVPDSTQFVPPAGISFSAQ
jgi:hypothetical protein